MRLLLLLLLLVAAAAAAQRAGDLDDMKHWLMNGKIEKTRSDEEQPVRVSSTTRAPVLDEFDWRSLMYMCYVVVSSVLLCITGAMFSKALVREKYAHNLSSQVRVPAAFFHFFSKSSKRD